jgi:hypothetical protein
MNFASSDIFSRFRVATGCSELQNLAPEDCIAAADKLERPLVGDLTEPVVFEPSEAFWVA